LSSTRFHIKTETLAILLLGYLAVVGLAPHSARAQSTSGSGADKSAQIFALAPILSEVGERRTRQWLLSVSQQCNLGKSRHNEHLCNVLSSFSDSTLWDEISLRLDQALELKCAARGLMTAYYEPVLQGTLVRESDRQVALYTVPEAAIRAVQTKQAWLSRAEIDHLTQDAPPEVLAKVATGLTPIVWIDDPVEAFFLQIQGSGRIQLRDREGSPPLRVGYAGHNGHNYRAIGATLVALGAMQREQVSANSIKRWLGTRLLGTPQEREQAVEVMRSNPRYIFFKTLPEQAGKATLGPLGALAVPLTEMASVAADPNHHALGSSLLVFTERLGAQLVQVQDVGAGIKGPGRLDLFTGTGEEAGALASDFKEILRSLEIISKARHPGQAPQLQLDVASALANCSGGM
jgi:membrane-bound lytic murein transglycosylase A